jgi:hypothetical protein
MMNHNDETMMMLLPSDCFYGIFQFLHVYEMIHTLSLVSRQWNSMIFNDSSCWSNNHSITVHSSTLWDMLLQNTDEQQLVYRHCHNIHLIFDTEITVSNAVTLLQLCVKFANTLKVSFNQRLAQEIDYTIPPIVPVKLTRLSWNSTQRFDRANRIHISCYELLESIVSNCREDLCELEVNYTSVKSIPLLSQYSLPSLHTLKITSEVICNDGNNGLYEQLRVLELNHKWEASTEFSDLCKRLVNLEELTLYLPAISLIDITFNKLKKLKIASHGDTIRSLLCASFMTLEYLHVTSTGINNTLTVPVTLHKLRTIDCQSLNDDSLMALVNSSPKLHRLSTFGKNQPVPVSMAPKFYKIIVSRDNDLSSLLLSATNLVKISFYSMCLTSESISLLSNCHSMNELSFDGVEINESNWLNTIAHSAPNLSIVNINGVHQRVTDMQKKKYKIELFDVPVYWKQFKLKACHNYDWIVSGNSLINNLKCVETLELDDCIQFMLSEIVNVAETINQIQIYLQSDKHNDLKYRQLPSNVNSVYFIVNNTMTLGDMLSVAICCHSVWNAKFIIHTSVRYKSYEFMKDFAKYYSGKIFIHREFDSHVPLILQSILSDTFQRIDTVSEEARQQAVEFYTNLLQFHQLQELWARPALYVLVREICSKEKLISKKLQTVPSIKFNGK